ncbi:hypothetical protein D3C71_1947220 [compost metagenome]
MAGEKRAEEAMDMFVKLFALEDKLAKSRQEELDAAAVTAAAAQKKIVQTHAASAVLAPITR